MPRGISTRLFEQANEHNRRSNIRLISVRSSSNPTVQMIAAFALAGVLFIAVREFTAGTLTLETFTPFLLVAMSTTPPLRRLLNVAGPLQQGIAAGASVFEVLDSPGEPRGGTQPLKRARGEVQFRDVSFEYAIEKGGVLHHIDVSVPAGATVAIVGRSGSGKSTLVSLLPRFYDPTGGAVLIDGVDIREYRVADLRRQMSLVSQEVVLFNDSIRNNILFGLADVSEVQLLAAARAAYVMEFVEQLPQGIETMVGDRGVLLSGGQRQRIAIARALLRDTPILILDEATSALDTAAERHIQAALDQLVRNRTTFVIAHRLSTVERADRILVMQRRRDRRIGPTCGTACPRRRVCRAVPHAVQRLTAARVPHERDRLLCNAAAGPVVRAAAAAVDAAAGLDAVWGRGTAAARGVCARAADVAAHGQAGHRRGQYHRGRQRQDAAGDLAVRAAVRARGQARGGAARLWRQRGPQGRATAGDGGQRRGGGRR